MINTQKVQLKKGLLFICIVIAFGLQSCQKEISDPLNTVTPGPVSADSTYIDKIYSIDVNGSISDTVTTTVYTYDSQKRVISFITTSNNPADSSADKYYYYYTGTDTLPYKSVYYEIATGVPVQTYIYTYFHYYDNSGRNSRDSLILQDPSAYYVTVIQYNYGLNKIYASKVSFTTTLGYFAPEDEKDTAFLDPKGNILQSKQYVLNPITSIYELNSISNFTYDNQISPFYKLSNLKSFGVLPYGESYLGGLPQYSNRTSQDQFFHLNTPFIGELAYTYTYTYKSNGLVKQGIQYDVPASLTHYSKALFTYRAL